MLKAVYHKTAKLVNLVLTKVIFLTQTPQTLRTARNLDLRYQHGCLNYLITLLLQTWTKLIFLTRSRRGAEDTELLFASQEQATGLKLI